MDEKVRCSVIVPAYNVENYLPRCMDSLINQTLQEIEIICIDDGSTDSSGKILDEYAAKDKRIRTVHQENEGQAYARNIGLDLIKTEWFTFVDSDDYVAPDLLEKMLQAIYRENADICICNSGLPDKGYRNVSSNKFKMRDEVITGYQALEYMNLPKSWPWITPWNKLYRTALFQNLRYPIVRKHEDQYLAHHIFVKARNVVSISDTLYYLCCREGSLMNSPYDICQLDYMGALYDRIQLYEQHGFRKLYAGVELKALKFLLQAYRKLGTLGVLERQKLQLAEQQYLEIYRIAKGKKQLDYVRKEVCKFAKGINHCAGV